MCDVAASVEKEMSTTERQVEAERKRKGGKGQGKERVRELEAKADEIRERRDSLADTLKALTDGYAFSFYSI